LLATFCKRRHVGIEDDSICRRRIDATQSDAAARTIPDTEFRRKPSKDATRRPITNLAKGDTMSDQLFVGVAPKTNAGKEYMFICMDDWIEIYKFIWSEVSDEFPPHPNMDKKTAELLADRLQKLLDYGVAHAYFVLVLRTRYLMEDEDNPDNELKPPARPGEDADEVERMIDLLKGYIRFLFECGGCKVDV
jgi:hypothetical protein